METSYEKISKNNANSSGKTDSNLANDTLHVGGIAAEDVATKEYVQKYHDTKEASLKEYIDEQDAKTLEESKEYTNSQIRNQDFSKFAKTTDIEALDEKMSNTITQGLTEQKNYTDTKAQQIVDDINSNFSDVNDAITQLNNNQTELFQSVSDGKAKIAEAITDKGVTTSATDTFDNMANNIHQITTSSGGETTEIPEGYVDTSDATADASKILLGYSAYANGSKVYGNLVPSSGSGNTTNPTYGTDTSDATATAGDILAGKTAYANGQLLVGTLKNLDVKEIYGLSTEEYTQNNISGYNLVKVLDEDGNFTTMIALATGRFGTSKDGRFIVRETKIYDVGEDLDVITRDEVEKGTFIGRFIESNCMSEDSIYISSTQEGNRKFRYSFEELGLDPNSDIGYISFGIPGYDGNSTECLLCITQGGEVHLYKYNCGSGSWGYIEESDTDKWHWQYDININETSTYLRQEIFCPPASANLSPNNFAILIGYGDTTTSGLLFISLYKESIFINISSTASGFIKIGATSYIQFSSNDSYICGHYYNTNFIRKIDTSSYIYNSIGNACVPDAAPTILFSETQALIGGKIYDIAYNSGDISITNESIQFITDGSIIKRASVDGNIIITHTSNTLRVYNTDYEATEAWVAVQTIPNIPLDVFEMFSMDLSFIIAGNSNNLYRIQKQTDTNIVGLKYKEKYYYLKESEGES